MTGPGGDAEDPRAGGPENGSAAAPPPQVAPPYPSGPPAYPGPGGPPPYPSYPPGGPPPGAPPYGGPPYPGAPGASGQPQYPGQPPYAGQPPYTGQPPYSGVPPYAAPPVYGSAPPYGGAPPPYGSTSYGYPSAGVMSPPYASWGRRLGGYLIDVAIITIPELIIAFGAHWISITHTVNPVTLQSTPHVHTRPVVFIFPLITLAYGMLFVGSERGQTPGMMAVGVQARDPRTGGSIGYGRALWRAFFEFLMAIVYSIPWIIDMLWPLWDGQKQTLHDKVSNTIVIRTDQNQPSRSQPRRYS